jgi:hypothetical protein
MTIHDIQIAIECYAADSFSPNKLRFISVSVNSDAVNIQ